MLRPYLICALLAVVVTLSGCATQSLRMDVAPGTDLQEFRTFYVRKLPADGRGVERLISEQLNTMGYSSTYGVSMASPHPVDIVVTYEDHWMWDITMYMLQLDIAFRPFEKPRTLGSSSRISAIVV